MVRGCAALERLALDRKTVRRYMGATTESGLGRGSSEADLDDAFMAKVCELARPVAPTATGRAGRCSKRRGIEACPKLSRASSCLFLGRSRSTSLRHPRFPRIGGFHEQRPPVTGIILLSPGNAHSRLGLDRMRFISFHVYVGGGT